MAISLEDAADAPARASLPLAVLEQAVSTGTLSARGRALAWLSRLGTEAASWAVRGLQDDSAWVQQEVMGSLVDPPGPEVRSALLSAARDPNVEPQVRARAAVLAGGPDALQAMTAALQGTTEPWAAGPLAFAAWRLGEGSARPALEAALASGELPPDLPFLDLLSARPDEGLARALAEAQPRVEGELELAVARTRLRLGDDAAEAVLRKALAGSDELRQAEAVDLLAELDGPVAESLLRRAASGGGEFVPLYAALVLAGRGLGEPSALERAAEDPNFELRQLAVRHAARALAGEGRRPARGAARVVLAGLTDPVGAVRAEAARRCGELGWVEALPSLEALLADDAERVRVEAAGAWLALAGQPPAG